MSRQTRISGSRDADMNSWDRDPQVEGVQLELRRTGCRRKSCGAGASAAAARRSEELGDSTAIACKKDDDEDGVDENCIRCISSIRHMISPIRTVMMMTISINSIIIIIKLTLRRLQRFGPDTSPRRGASRPRAPRRGGRETQGRTSPGPTVGVDKSTGEGDVTARAVSQLPPGTRQTHHAARWPGVARKGGALAAGSAGVLTLRSRWSTCEMMLYHVTPYRAMSYHITMLYHAISCWRWSAGQPGAPGAPRGACAGPLRAEARGAGASTPLSRPGAGDRGGHTHARQERAGAPRAAMNNSRAYPW